jgi:hypothetical protein
MNKLNKKTKPGLVPAQSEPKLPHERDESVSTTGAEPSDKVEQASRDLARGLQDTDRGPEIDGTYRKLKR